jgi:hypothetical protein
MSRIYDALKKAEAERDVSITSKLWRMVPRLMAARPVNEPSPALPALLEPREPEVDLRALRSAVDRLDDRLSHEMTEREGKLLEELRRGMLRLETELSERFAASVLETRRTLRTMFAAFAFLVACLAGVAAVILAYV